VRRNLSKKVEIRFYNNRNKSQFADSSELEQDEHLLAINEYTREELIDHSLGRTWGKIWGTPMSERFEKVERDGIVHFSCQSGTNPPKRWNQIIQFLDFSEIQQMVEEDDDPDDRTIKELMLDSDLAVYCNDPSFIYYGFQYIAWELGYGLRSETRPPDIRNPDREGVSCFPPDTIVRTRSGYKKICDIAVGTDKVLTHKGRFREVSSKSGRLVDELFKIKFNKGTIITTRYHPFYVKREGSNQWVYASDLKFSDKLLYIESIKPFKLKQFPLSYLNFEKKEEVVYNLSVLEDNSFTIGYYDIVVHNCKHIMLVITNLDKHIRDSIIPAYQDKGIF